MTKIIWFGAAEPKIFFSWRFGAPIRGGGVTHVRAGGTVGSRHSGEQQISGTRGFSGSSTTPVRLAFAQGFFCGFLCSDSSMAGRAPSKRPAVTGPAGEMLAGSCIVVGPPKEDAVPLLPAAFRGVVSQASVLEVVESREPRAVACRADVHCWEGRFRRRLGADVCFTTVFYWDGGDVVERSAWQGVAWNRPSAPSTKHPCVIMWSRGTIRGVEATGLPGSAEKKDTDAGTQTRVLQTCFLRLCISVVVFLPKGAVQISASAILDYFSMLLCYDLLVTMNSLLPVTTKRQGQKRHIETPKEEAAHVHKEKDGLEQDALETSKEEAAKKPRE